jgi:hypothetical protein
MAGDGMALHRRVHTFRCVAQITAGLTALALLILISPFLSNLAWADSLKRPFWTEQAMFQVGDDLFFVGQASCAKTSEAGRQQAFDHGMQEILNYAQTRDSSGLSIDTQMVFEETASPGCSRSTVTVWRLLRVDAHRLMKLAAVSRRLQTIETKQPSSMPRTLPLSIGMSREDVFDRLGLPASITMHEGNECTWEYRRYGLAVEFDRHMVVKRWTTLRAEAQQSSIRRTVQPLVATNDDPVVDLTPRLRNLEQMGQDVGLTVSTVYNQAVFSQHPMSPYVGRSLITAEAATSTVNMSPRPDAISGKVSGLCTYRAEDGGLGRAAFIHTKRGIMISPACANPWNR